MTDAHCHLPFNEDSGITARLVCAVNQNDWIPLSSLKKPDIPFFGIHPWESENVDIDKFRSDLRTVIESNPLAGVGETGMDRLKSKTIENIQRELFTAHLEVASELKRPVVLHGAKCWGEVFKECAKHKGIPSFLFHGFSRSGGLVDDIISINGYFSVGPSILNDHAVNYRTLVKTLPLDRILVETDCDGKKEIPPIISIVEKIAEVMSIGKETLLEQIETNILRFLSLG